MPNRRRRITSDADSIDLLAAELDEKLEKELAAKLEAKLEAELRKKAAFQRATDYHRQSPTLFQPLPSNEEDNDDTRRKLIAAGNRYMALPLSSTAAPPLRPIHVPRLRLPTIDHHPYTLPLGPNPAPLPAPRFQRDRKHLFREVDGPPTSDGGGGACAITPPPTEPQEYPPWTAESTPLTALPRRRRRLPPIDVSEPPVDVLRLRPLRVGGPRPQQPPATRMTKVLISPDETPSC